MEKKLKRELTLMAVIAAALCGVIGGGINVLIAEIQKEIIGIGDLVPLAMLIAGILAFIIALVYAILSTSMPRAGGEYLYISRGISPFWGFSLAFLKWAGAVINLGTIAYMDASIAATAFSYIGLNNVAIFLSKPLGAIIFSLILIWTFWLINVLGLKEYTTSVISLSALMIIGGLIIDFIGLTHTKQDFINIMHYPPPKIEANVNITDFLGAVGILFWTFIGFTSIAQAGGEIENPKRNLPKAFIYAVTLITLYYLIYSFSFYHAVPWQYVAKANNPNVPFFIGKFLPRSFAAFITIFVFIALANNIPPLLYTKSRLFYAWAKDGILPSFFTKLNKRGVPEHSITIIAILGSLIAIISALGGFLTEINVVVFSRFFLYASIALSLITLKNKNPKLYNGITFIKNRTIQIVLASIVIIASLILAYSIFIGEINSKKPFYLLSSVHTLILFLIGALIFYGFVKKSEKKGLDWRKAFEKLPE